MDKSNIYERRILSLVWEREKNKKLNYSFGLPIIRYGLIWSVNYNC